MIVDGLPHSRPGIPTTADMPCFWYGGGWHALFIPWGAASPWQPGTQVLDEVRDEGDGRGAAPDVSINIHSKPFIYDLLFNRYKIIY